MSRNNSSSSLLPTTTAEQGANSKLGRKTINGTRDFIKREMKILTILLSSYSHGSRNSTTSSSSFNEQEVEESGPQLSVAFVMTILRVLQVPLANKPSAVFSIGDALQQSRLARKNLPKTMKNHLSPDSKIKDILTRRDLCLADFQSAWDPKVGVQKLNDSCVRQTLYKEWNIRDGWYGGLIDPESLPAAGGTQQLAELQVKQSIYLHFYHGYLPFVLKGGILRNRAGDDGDSKKATTTAHSDAFESRNNNNYHQNLLLPSPPLWDEFNLSDSYSYNTAQQIKNPSLYWVDAIKGMIDGDQMDLCASFLQDTRIVGFPKMGVDREMSNYANFASVLSPALPSSPSRFLSKRTAEVLTGPIERTEEFYMTNLPVIKTSSSQTFDTTTATYEYFKNPKTGLYVNEDRIERELKRANSAQRPGKMSWGLPWLNFLCSEACVYSCHHTQDEDPLLREKEDVNGQRRFSLTRQRCGSCCLTKRIFDWCCSAGSSDPFGDRKPKIYDSCRGLTKREHILISIVRQAEIMSTDAQHLEAQDSTSSCPWRPTWFLPVLLRTGSSGRGRPASGDLLPEMIDRLLVQLVASGDLTMLRHLAPALRKVGDEMMDLSADFFPLHFLTIQPELGPGFASIRNARGTLLELAIMFFQLDSMHWLLFEAEGYHHCQRSSSSSSSGDELNLLKSKVESLFENIVDKTLAMGEQIAKGTGHFKYTESVKREGPVFLLPQVPYQKSAAELHALLEEMKAMWQEFLSMRSKPSS